MLHFSHSAPYCYRLQLVAWYPPALYIATREKVHTSHFSYWPSHWMRRESHAHVSAFLPVPTQLPANKRYTLFAFSIPSFSHFLWSLWWRSTRPMQNYSNNEFLTLAWISLPKKRQDVQCVSYHSGLFLWTGMHFTCISPISSAHLHTSLAPGLITITQPFCKLHDIFLLLFVHAYAFLWPLRPTTLCVVFLVHHDIPTKTGPIVIIHHHHNLSLECPFTVWRRKISGPAAAAKVTAFSVCF